jgi:hypothetical protein
MFFQLYSVLEFGPREGMSCQEVLVVLTLSYIYVNVAALTTFCRLKQNSSILIKIILYVAFPTINAMMCSLRVLPIVCFLAGMALVSASNDGTGALKPLPGINYRRVQAIRPATPDKPTQNYQRVKACHGARSNTRSVAALLGVHQRKNGGSGYENITSTTAYGTQYAIEMLFHKDPMMVILDTGSSDTWVVKESFQCVDYAMQPIDQAACGFGPTYTDDFQYGAIPHNHMYTKYGDGEMAYGPMGYSDITVGHIKVKKQEVALVTVASWDGNNETSGVIGLAYPSLTNCYSGDGMEHGWADEVEYSPLFTSMIQQGLVQPYFSIAISRNSSGGFIGWGGIPAVTGLDYSGIAQCDLIVVSINLMRPNQVIDADVYTKDQAYRQSVHRVGLLLLHHHP